MTILQIQIALALLGYAPGPLDGAWGPKTSGALLGWRLAHNFSSKPPRADAAEQATLEMAARDRQAKAIGVKTPTLAAISPARAGRRYAAAPGELQLCLNAALRLTAADTVPRAAHLLAQLAHESDGFHALTEYASGEAYEGRSDLGNTQPGDGRRFKGRGLIQLTGRHNYTQATAFLHASGWLPMLALPLDLDLVEVPESAADPLVAAATAAWYWLSRGLPAAVDERAGIEAITKAVNGGTNGLKDRKLYLARAEKALTAARLAA